MTESDKSLSVLWHTLGVQLLLSQSLSKWRKTPETSIRVLYKDLFKKTFSIKDGSYDSKWALYSAIGSTQASLLRQTLVLHYEFLRNNIGDKMSNELKNIKNSAFSNSNNYNTAKFLDIIRQSFSHNDIYKEFPNWTLNTDGKIEMYYKNDKLTFTFLELQTIINEFLLLKKEHTMYCFEISEDELREQIKKKKLNADNLGRYITCKDEKGNTLVLDDKQKSAIVNLIYSTNFEYLIRYNYYVFAQAFPLKNNAGTLLRYTNRLFRNLCSLAEGFQNRQVFINSSKNFEKVVDLIDRIGGPVQEQHMIDFMYNNSMIPEVIIYTNALFTLFSLHTPEDLKPYTDGVDIDLKRLRNSLMHGRYYFNYKDSVEFYDGKDNENLKHIGTLTIKQITSIFDRYITENAISKNVLK